MKGCPKSNGGSYTRGQPLRYGYIINMYGLEPTICAHNSHEIYSNIMAGTTPANAHPSHPITPDNARIGKRYARYRVRMD